VATPERIASVHRAPLIRLENGPEFISNELDLWAWLHGVDFDFSRPGKPTDNAFAASFNGRSRESAGTPTDSQPGRCVAELRGLAEDYNDVRPTSAIGTRNPLERAFTSGQECLT
jgi:putative transposase